MVMTQPIGPIHLGVLDDRTANTELTPTAVRELLDRQSTLLAMVLHELRGPLTVLAGHLSLITEDALGPPAESATATYDRMACAVQEMSDLVDGLAAVARRETRCEIRRAPCHLGSLAAAAVASVQYDADERHVSIEQDAPIAVVEDALNPEHVRIATVNLLRNAVKHSPRGARVLLSIQANESSVRIAVANDGSGIDPLVLPHLFEPWYRGPASSGRGWGLGLWIVQQVAAWHGGQVSVESLPRSGSTFTLVLPRN
jgi:signal transduction histidine kinase